MGLLVVMPLGSEFHEDITPRALDYAGKIAKRYGELVTPTRNFPRLYERENYWARFARMRNYVIDSRLMTRHTEVLWIDADIVEFPEDLYADLVLARETVGDAGDIIAPMTLIESSMKGGDPAGCRDHRDRRSSHDEPWFTTQPIVSDDRGRGIIPLVSVGACVLVPATIHRMVRFEAQRDLEPTGQTEWLSLCDGAYNKGHKVWLDTRIQVEHADLPRYGIAWHSGLQELIDWGVA